MFRRVRRLYAHAPAGLAANSEEPAGLLHRVIRRGQLQQAGKLTTGIRREIEQHSQPLELLGIADHAKEVHNAIVNVVIDLDFALRLPQQHIGSAAEGLNVNPVFGKAFDEPFGVVGLTAVPRNRRLQPFSRPLKDGTLGLSRDAISLSLCWVKKKFLGELGLWHRASPIERQGLIC